METVETQSQQHPMDQTVTEPKTPDSPSAATDPMQDPMQDEELPLLDLSESLKRAVVRGPEGTPYELRTPEEFSVEDEHLLRSELEIFSELQQKRNLNDNDRANLRLRLDKTFDKLIVASDAAKASFNDRQRQRVLLFFRTQWAMEDLAAVNEAKNEIEKVMKAADNSTMAS